VWGVLLKVFKLASSQQKRLKWLDFEVADGFDGNTPHTPHTTHGHRRTKKRTFVDVLE